MTNLPARTDDPPSVLGSTETPSIFRDETGELPVEGAYWVSVAAEILSIPAREQGIDTASAVDEQRRLATHLVRGLRAWHNVGALEFRYIWGGDPSFRVVLIARGLGRSPEAAHDVAIKLLHNIVSLLPVGYEVGSPRSTLDTHLDLDREGWVEVERLEEVRPTAPFVPADIATFYYLPHPMGGSGRGWPRLPAALAKTPRPGFISVTLLPTVLTDVERSAVDHVCSVARHVAEPRQDHDFFGNLRTIPADAAAEDVVRIWGRIDGRAGVLAKIGVCAYHDDLIRLASMVGAIITDGDDDDQRTNGNAFKIVSDLDSFQQFVSAGDGTVLPRYRHEIWHGQYGEPPFVIQRLPYFFTEEEAGGLLMLPVPDEQGVPGMPRARRHASRRAMVADLDTGGDGVVLGQVIHEGSPVAPAKLPLEAVNRHVLVVGTPGSGKTTTVLSMLASLWRDHGVPFLVIEPTKSEYRTLLDAPGMDELRVIALGRDDVAPMRLNPLAPPPGVRMEVQANAVLASLKAALPLWPPLPQLLEDAIERAYRRAGWDHDSTIDDGLTPPSLRTVMACFEDVFAEADYVGDARNVAAAMATRLKSLVRGSKGRVLDTVESIDFAALLARPVVVEMDEIADPEDKAVMASFLLDRIRASARSRGSSEGWLRHVTVVEEAHRLLPRLTPVGSDDGGDPRSAGVEAFCNAIAELRSVGEGFILSSQSPSRLAAAAVDNCGTRILHRIESAADREVVLNDLDASDLERQAAARLRVGEAVARWPQLDEPEIIQVVAGAGVDSGAVVTTDDVRQRMAAETTLVRSLLPYPMCTREMCPSGCEPRVRADGQDIADETAAFATATWKEHPPREAVPLIARHLRDATDDDVQSAYCAAAHLAAHGRALVGAPRRVDIAARVRAALEEA